MNRHTLMFVHPKAVKIQQEKITLPAENQVLVKTLYSSISAGTEMLLYRNQVKQGMLMDTTIPALSIPFRFPCKYGYSCVGQVIAVGDNVNTKWLDALVFAFHPHESHFLIPSNEIIALPSGMELKDAMFLPNMETALNLMMDGSPLIGENVVVFGQGVVGLLLTSLLAQMPLSSLITIDAYPLRRAMSERFGAMLTFTPGQGIQKHFQNQASKEPIAADLCFEVSGNPSTLSQAIRCTRYAGRIIVGSWYGTKKTRLDLNDQFHRNRIHIISSQVSTIDPRFADRWTKQRRLRFAFDMVQKIRPSQLITHTFPFEQAEQAYKLIDSHPEKTIQVIFSYEGE